MIYKIIHFFILCIFIIVKSNNSHGNIYSHIYIYLFTFLIHSINSPIFSQSSCQLANSSVKLTVQPTIPPLLDKFPQTKKNVIILLVYTRSQITEKPYLLMFLHSYFSILDINTTVSTWTEWSVWINFNILSERRM